MGHLKHVQIAVAVARLKRLDRSSDQELALARMADPFPTRSVTDTFQLMQWMGDVIRERGLLEHPLAVRARRSGKG